MNNTHVYSLRRTPVGYNGPTSMYEGTRVISIAQEPHADEKKTRDNNTRHGQKNAARRPTLKKNPVRGEIRDRRMLDSQNPKRSSQSQTNGRRPSVPVTADRRDRGARMSPSNPNQSGVQNHRRPVSPTAPKQRPVADDRRVLSRSQAGTGDFTAGVSVMSGRGQTGATFGRTVNHQMRGDRTGESGRARQTSVRGAQPSHAASLMYRTQKTQVGARADMPRDGRAYPQKESPAPRDSGTRIRGYTEYGGNPRYDTQSRYSSQTEKNIRGGYNTQNMTSRDMRENGYHTERMRASNRGNTLQNHSERYSGGATYYGTSGGYSSSDIQMRGNVYNKNPVYCYGNRTSAEAENNRLRTSDIRDRRGTQPAQAKPKQKKLTPEEKSRMRAADNARKRAEKQIALEHRKKKKAQIKVRRGVRRVQRRAAAKEFQAALVRALVRSVPFAVLFFITFAISAGLFAVSVFAALNINISDLPDTVRYQIGEDEADDKITFDLPAERFIRDGTVYMSMDDFAERFEYTVAGNSKELKYISRTSDDIVEVTVGTSAVAVNDVPLRLIAPVVRDGEEILIPLDFFATYVTGFSVSYDADVHKVTMIREITGYTVSVADGKTPIYSGAGFKPSLLSQTPNIAEGSLPSDILAATDPNPPTPETDELGNPLGDGSGVIPE